MTALIDPAAESKGNQDPNAWIEDAPRDGDDEDASDERMAASRREFLTRVADSVFLAAIGIVAGGDACQPEFRSFCS